MQIKCAKNESQVQSQKIQSIQEQVYDQLQSLENIWEKYVPG